MARDVNLKQKFYFETELAKREHLALPVASNQVPSITFFFLMACCRGTWVNTHLVCMETLPTHCFICFAQKKPRVTTEVRDIYTYAIHHTAVEPLHNYLTGSRRGGRFTAVIILA